MKAETRKYVRILAAALLGLAVFLLKAYLDRQNPSATVIRPSDETVGSSEVHAPSSTSSGKNDPASLYSEKQLPVYICGAVAAPGVYEIHAGSFLYEIFPIAGDLLETAAVEYLHMVFEIREPVSIYVPTYAEVEKYLLDASDSSGLLEGSISLGILRLGGNSAFVTGISPSAGGSAVLVNLNTATSAELQVLPGIGESTAERIICDRDERGPFSSVEDIMRVQGIKEGRFEAIKDLITV